MGGQISVADFGQFSLGVYIDSLPSENAAMKIIYLRVAELNERRSYRVIKEYYKCKDQFTKMYRERYP